MVLTSLLKSRTLSKAGLHLLAAAPLLWLVERVLREPQTLGANPVAEVTDSLGLWALRLLLLTLALTPLRWLLHSSRPILYRRMLGLWAALYALLHLVMYVVVDQRIDWPVLVEDVLKRPWITVGALGAVILAVLSATSPHAVRRALGRTWDRLHRSVYAAALLGVWHYYWQVKKDVRAPLLYAAVLLALLLARVYARRLRARSGPATVPERI
jgi:sulfoxide reductase heme-binding subunit YedZ